MFSLFIFLLYSSAFKDQKLPNNKILFASSMRVKILRTQHIRDLVIDLQMEFCSSDKSQSRKYWTFFSHFLILHCNFVNILCIRNGQEQQIKDAKKEHLKSKKSFVWLVPF